ncbi:MAG: protein translocase subunit SecF [Bacilli bacterium]|nr:protein translocase subunit SecF [Bacilli bacterium]
MENRFDIAGRRKLWFIISVTILILGILTMFWKGLNLGTDFTPGSRVQVNLGAGWKSADVQSVFNSVNLTNADITSAGTFNEQAVIRLGTTLTTDQEKQIKDALKSKFAGSQDPQIDTVSPMVAQEQSKTAIIAVLIASVGIILYMSIRFEYRFAVSGVLSLLQVVLIVISLFALFRVEVNLTFVAALLTIVGYCIHDTIVIFDRIRENLKFTKVKTVADLEKLVNTSLWQTMRRSIYTIITVVIAAGMIFLIGGPSIHNFALALLIGLVAGGLSSIFIASQLWLSWRARSLK